MYRDHSHEHHEHFNIHADEPHHDIHHAETYGSHKAADRFEVEHGVLADQEKRLAEQKEERFIQPVFEHRESYEHDGPLNEHHAGREHHSLYGEDRRQEDAHYAPSSRHSREVEYEVDEHGHVHMYEAEPEYQTSFLQ